MLIGFTVMQNAFASGGLGYGAINDSERKALALTGCGDTIFDWDVSSDRVYVSPEVETQLGLYRGASSKARRRNGWKSCIRSSVTVIAPVSIRCSSKGAGASIRNSACAPRDGHYFWFLFKARPVIGPEGEVIRVIGTLSDITEQKTAQTRLLHDAVHDNLTGPAEPRIVLRPPRRGA